MSSNVADKSRFFKARKGGWCRFYADSLDNLKLQSLPADLYKVWANCLALATERNGYLPPAATIAFRLRMSAHDASIAIDELISRGLIDIMERAANGPVMRMHDWDEHQFRGDHSAAERMRKLRNRKHGVTSPLRNARRNRSLSVSVSTSTSTVEQVDTERVSQEEESLPLRSVSTHEEDVA